MTEVELSQEDPALVDLRMLCSRANRVEEGGLVYFLLPELQLPERAKPQRCDALLCMGPRDGYPSRLFFAVRVEGPSALNWNTDAFILQRQWHAYSWKIQEGLPPVRQLSAHLRALR